MQIPIIAQRGQRKPWGSIPRINWSHPLTRGLLFYHYDTPAGGFDLTLNRKWSLISANRIPVRSTSWGTGHVFPSSATDGIQYQGDASLRILPPMSWMCGFSRAIAATEDTCAFFGRAANNGTSAPGFNWAIADNRSATANDVCIVVNSGGAFTPSTGSNRVLNQFHTFGASASSTSTYNIFADGVNLGSVAGLTIQNVTTGDNIFIGTDTGGPGGFQGQVYWGGFWNRTLSNAEALQLHQDSYCFLIYPEDEMFATLVGSGVTPPGPGPNFLTSLLPMMGVG